LDESNTRLDLSFQAEFQTAKELLIQKLHTSKSKKIETGHTVIHLKASGGLQFIEKGMNSMTRMIDNCSNTAPWTTNRLEEELYLHLVKVNQRDENDGSIKRKYVQQAKYLIYRIPLGRPTPSFIVSLTDLSDKIKSELEGLDNQSLDEVMKDAIGRLFESINERYYLLSVKKLLKWKLVE
jgi:hypothetical protein